MPIDYKRYPSNWKTEIRPAILARADNRCEECKVKNYSVGFWSKEGVFYTSEDILTTLEDTGRDLFDNELSHIPEDKKPVKVVLTISHTNHDITDNRYENLKALCQFHHLKHDAGHHKQTRRKNRGLQELF